MTLLRVGEVAKRTGLTVRALHHYDEIGLLTASHRSDSGYRLYSNEDLMQLQKIKSLQLLDFSLEEIGKLIKKEGMTLSTVIHEQIQTVNAKVEQQNVLLERLEQLEDNLSKNQIPSTDLLLEVLNMTKLSTTRNRMMTYLPRLTPYLTVRDLKQAIAFYEKAFGFKLQKDSFYEDEDGLLIHATMQYKDAAIMLRPEAPGTKSKAPLTMGAESPVWLYLYCDDVDQMFQRAVEAGCTVVHKPEDKLGDRMCKVIDPEGHSWSFGKCL